MRTVVEIDHRQCELGAMGSIDLAQLKASCECADVMTALREGKTVEIVPGVRAIAQHAGVSCGLTVRVGAADREPAPQDSNAQ